MKYAICISISAIIGYIIGESMYYLIDDKVLSLLMAIIWSGIVAYGWFHLAKHLGLVE
jgi:hypothetical protein